jgi:hypothetical protein
MFKTLKISLLIVGGLILSITTAKTSIAEAPAPVIPPKEPTVQELVSKYALMYNVSEQRMLGTMKCESGFNPKAIGDKGTSFGLSQIHLPAHPTITKEQALNPDFAVQFMAKSFAQGKERMWTCWRLLYGVK